MEPLRDSFECASCEQEYSVDEISAFCERCAINAIRTVGEEIAHLKSELGMAEGGEYVAADERAKQAKDQLQEAQATQGMLRFEIRQVISSLTDRGGMATEISRLKYAIENLPESVQAHIKRVEGLEAENERLEGWVKWYRRAWLGLDEAALSLTQQEPEESNESE